MSRRFRIVVCRGPECGDKRDSASVHAAFARELAATGTADRCQLEWQSCFGRCSQGPNVLVREITAAAAQSRPRFALADLPAARGGGPRMVTALYNHVAPVNVPEVIASHVLRGVVVHRLIERPPLAVSIPATSEPPRPTNDDTDTIVCEALPDVPTP